jgi:hypothetical protein
MRGQSAHTLHYPESSAPDLSRDPDEIIAKLRLQISPHRTGSLRRRFVIGGRNGVRDSDNKEKAVDQDTVDRLNAHRKLHSAESGQLMPRTRRHTTDINAPSSVTLGSAKNDSPSRTTSWPPTESAMRLGQNNPQKAERKISAPAVPQHASIEVPPAAKPCPSAWSSRTHQLMSEKLADERSKPMPGAFVTSSSTIPSTASTSTLDTTTAPTENLSIPNTQTRKVNEGFEVLPAGTLDKESSTFKILGLWPATVAARPNQRKPNKLRKRSLSRSRSGSVSSISSYGSEKDEDTNVRVLETRQTIH